MRITKVLVATLLGVAGFTSCTQDNEQIEATSATLQVRTSIKGTAASRTVVEGNDLGGNQKIGVSVFNTDGSNYTGKTGFTNILFSSQALTGSTVWSTSTPITLAPTTGKAIAYYPYSPDANIEAIPVKTTPVVDYMYSDWVEGLNSSNPQATFSMNHALCAIKISFINETYVTDPGNVTKVSIKSQGLGTAATLNAKTGMLSAVSGNNMEMVSNEAFTVTKEVHAVTFTGVPTGTQGNLEIQVVMDGKTFTVPATLSAPFEKGKLYTMLLKAKDKVAAFEVSSVTVKPWVNQDLGQGVIGGGK